LDLDQGEGDGMGQVLATGHEQQFVLYLFSSQTLFTPRARQPANSPIPRRGRCPLARGPRFSWADPDNHQKYVLRGETPVCNPVNGAAALGEATVTIYDLLKPEGAFSPEEVTMLDGVFRDVLKTLGLVKRKDPVTEMIARKLVDLAVAGMRDPVRLKALTIQAFTEQQQQQQQIQRKPARRAPWLLNKLFDRRRIKR
jgi:hypothetical protein